jgi:zinc protease
VQGEAIVNQLVNSDVLETQLSNGLGVLLKEVHSAPIASIWTWYRVGSRNEVPGKTGISHWVEHMQFKGTPRIAKGQIFRDVSRVGGTLNALTSHDWTAYFETLPADKLDLALTIESDRMANSLFDTAEVESERTVILSERQGSENNPGYALYEEVNGTAFQAHPYRHMVIGYESDLRQITRNDLFEHYRRYYHPANAFIVAVGDFSATELLTRIEQQFGSLPAGELIPRELGVAEPPQPGERRVLIRKPSGASYLRVGFHAPPGDDRDLVSLLVTEAILSGGQPMGFGGGGAMGRSSRLYRALVASGLARSANSDMSVTIDPYLFQIGVTALPNISLAAVERVVDEELGRLRDELATAGELERAIKQIEAQYIYSSEGVTNQAYWLGQWNVVDAWTRAESLPEEIRAVTAEDVQRVAQRYLSPDRRTVGWLVPTEGSGSGDTVSVEPNASYLSPLAWGLSGPFPNSPATGASFQRAVLANGVPVLGQDRPESQSIAMRVRIPAGTIRETTTEPGIAYLAARTTMRGSGGQSFEEISTRTDALGGSISVEAGRQFTEARVRCLRGDFPEMVDLLAQTLLRPDFPDDEVALIKSEQLGAISEADNDTRATADRLLRHAVYPNPNPLGRRVLGDKTAVSNFDSSQVRRFHSSAYLPTGTSMAVVGNMGGFDRANEIIASRFEGWTQSSAPRAPLDLSSTNQERTQVAKGIHGKRQADLAVGIATIARDSNDYYALDVANLILGRLGLMGRLGAEVRDQQGLAYYAYSQIEPRVDGSLWSARAGVDPGNVDLALEAIARELDRMRSELVPEEELRDAKSYLLGVLPLALESHDGVASTLLTIEEFDLGLDFLQRYPAIINALTRADVLEVARRRLDPERRAVAVARPE